MMITVVRPFLQAKAYIVCNISLRFILLNERRNR
nr:MAG TPA: hypothetical protein [Caudoviricetes sp.]